MDLFVVLLGGVTALLPIFAQDILQIGPWGLGLLRAAPAVGRDPCIHRIGLLSVDKICRKNSFWSNCRIWASNDPFCPIHKLNHIPACFNDYRRFRCH